MLYNNIIVVDDVCNDFKIKEFFENYLKFLDIFFRFDVGIWICGEMVGVVCIEKCI